MDKNLNSIKQHLENLGFKFFNDSSYWDWGGQQFYDNQISEKKLNKLYDLQEKISENPSYNNKMKFYDYIATNDIFIKVIHSMKLNAIAESCNEVVTEITETGKILDLGCNTGYLTSFYSKVFKESHLYGFDVCQKSILKAKQINTGFNNLNFINNLKDIDGLDFSYVIDTQCLSDINDKKTLISLIKKIKHILSNNGKLVSISTLTNEENANDFIKKFINLGFFLCKLEPVIFRGIEGYESYTKLLFEHENNNFEFNISDYFIKLRAKLTKKNMKF